jgi:hypothetical protein
MKEALLKRAPHEDTEGGPEEGSANKGGADQDSRQ